MDAAIVEVLSKLGGIFTVKEELKNRTEGFFEVNNIVLL